MDTRDEPCMDSYLEKMARKTLDYSKSGPIPLSCGDEKMIKKFLYDLKNKAISPYYMITKKGRFTYEGKQFKYFIHWYNHTWDNCRKLEIPIFLWLYYLNQHRSVLEVGNVFSHYIPITHVVLDKYEKSKGVINEDIVDYRPDVKYDVVLSCSTLEHVGFDEDVKDPDGFLKAVNNIKENVLRDGGVLYLSVPVGYNPDVDRVLASGLLHFDSVVHYSQDGWHIIIGVIRK